MSSERRRWDLLADGWLWKEAASAVIDPEFRKRCEIVVSCLQDSLDRTDGGQFLAADCAAVAFIRKHRVLRYDAAHARIAAVNANQNVQGSDEAVRESARIAASFAPDDVLDRVLKYESFCDRQINKYMELIDRLWRCAEEQRLEAPRKPSQSTVSGEEDQKSGTG